MQRTRYYHKRAIGIAGVRTLRDVLRSSFDWGFSYASYCLYWPSEYITVSAIDEIEPVLQEKGQPDDVRVSFTSTGGQMLTLDTRGVDLRSQRMQIELDRIKGSMNKLLQSIEAALSLEPIGEVPSERKVSSAFVAHAFDDHGQAYANELGRFLGLLGIRCHSGRGFAPKSVAEKVTSRLAAHDVFVGIATPQEDYTWITQEIATAAAIGKPAFILKESDVKLKEGILGDHEYIAFPKGQLSKSFIPVLEGLNDLQGIDSSQF
ncbi:MAG: hypothetical protein WD049_10070 [Candidatus Paceibacterota bacterium]